MFQIVLIVLNLIFGILFLSSAFNGVNFWQGMDKEKLKEYYDEMSDKDVAFKMGYVTYRNYMQQLKGLKVSVYGIVTKVDYSILKNKLKNYQKQVEEGIPTTSNENQMKDNIKIPNRDQENNSGNNVLKKKKFRLPFHKK